MDLKYMATQTYCNPLPLPDYPIGRAVKEKSTNSGFLQKPKRDFRETADPSVIFYNNRWYLYPSAGMAYISDDFITWRHHKIEPSDCGYAPTVVHHRRMFYLTACEAPLFRSTDPLGPFQNIGHVLTPSGKRVKHWLDPMLFSDDDGKIYAYWGLAEPGIFGAELDPGNPARMLTEPKILFKYNPEHAWERFGPNNENPAKSYVEGSWMIKIGNRYFLTYAAPNTEYRTYCMGTYVSDKPLGPFHCQKRNPILGGTDGLIKGPGHGCIVKGPKKTLWAFYTCNVCYEHIFERRIGMDPAGIDNNGNLFVNDASETPQFAPGCLSHPEKGNDFDLYNVTDSKAASASSSSTGRKPIYSVDKSMLTWWEPSKNDTNPLITWSLNGTFHVSALRIIWKDVGLDISKGKLPGPFRYRVEVCCDNKSKKWVTVSDKRKNSTDMLIDYCTFKPIKAQKVRLNITGWPDGIQPGLVDFSLFGK
jgi:hypothetical protein